MDDIEGVNAKTMEGFRLFYELANAQHEFILSLDKELSCVKEDLQIEKERINTCMTDIDSLEYRLKELEDPYRKTGFEIYQPPRYTQDNPSPKLPSIIRLPEGIGHYQRERAAKMITDKINEIIERLNESGK